MHLGRQVIPLAVMALFLSWFVCATRAQQPPDYDKAVFKTVEVTDNFYVLVATTGGNIGVSVGTDGMLLVDDQYTPLYRKVRDALAHIGSQPVRFVVSTHWHGDHLGGNELMAKSGALLVAHENVRKRLIAQRSNPNADWRNPPLPDTYLPVITYPDRMALHFNGDEVTIFHPGPAHTDGDSIVSFRQANVLHAGDVFVAARYPVIIPAQGGSVDGTIAALDRILKIANRDTKIIPGHGSVPATLKDVQDQHDRILSVRDKVFSQIKAGKTLEQVLASKPTAGFEGNRTAGSSPDDFVKLVYQDLSAKH